MGDTQYPFPSMEAAAEMFKRTPLERLSTWLETKRMARRERKKKRRHELTCLNARGPATLSADDIPLMFITHNDLKLLPSFLAHYRKLGVTRFICIDDVSADGTREYLVSQPDVDAWSSTVRFKEARRGREWRETLFERYGTGRWYVNVDSDEYLVYDGYEERGLRWLIPTLERMGARRLLAPMLDMYPVDLERADVEKLKHQAPWEIADHFDSTGYTMHAMKRAFSVKGGPRHRKFGTDLEMVKYPLMFWDGECCFGPSIHQPLPYDRNFPAAMGVLLHFKFFADYAEVVDAAAAGGQYFNTSAVYVTIKESIASAGGLQLTSDVSVRFTGSKQLLNLGFITRLERA